MHRPGPSVPWQASPLSRARLTLGEECRGPPSASQSLRGSCAGQTGCEQPLLCRRFRYFLTLLAECFAPFEQSTCALSVSCRVRVSSQRYTREPQATGSGSPTLEEAAKGRPFRALLPQSAVNVTQGVFTLCSLRKLVSSSWNVTRGRLNPGSPALSAPKPPAWSARGRRPQPPWTWFPEGKAAPGKLFDSRLTGRSHLSVLTFHSPLLRETQSLSSPLPKDMLKLGRSLSRTVRMCGTPCFSLGPENDYKGESAHTENPLLSGLPLYFAVGHSPSRRPLSPDCTPAVGVAGKRSSLLALTASGFTSLSLSPSLCWNQPMGVKTGETTLQ